MNQLFYFFVIAAALVTNGAFGQREKQQNDNDLEDRYGWYGPHWNEVPSYPQFPNQNLHPGYWNSDRPYPPRPTTTIRPTRPTTQSPDAIQACIDNCIVTSEYNPVCGTNGVLYTNPGGLICAQMCGVGVSLLRTGRCPERMVLV